MNRRKRCFSYLENPKRAVMAMSPVTWSWDLPVEKPLGTSIDEYWNRWNWGEQWQIPGPVETRLNSELSSPAYANESTEYNLHAVETEPTVAQNEGIINNQVPQEKDTEIPEADNEMVVDTLAGAPAELDEAEKDLDDGGEIRVREEVVLNVNEIAVIPDITLQNEEPVDEPQAPVANAVEDQVGLPSPVVTKPKTVVWKSFPKPIGK